MVNMERSCVESSHMQMKEIRYSTKKCSICKKRCLFRTWKMVKCIVCKCTVHKRCLALASAELLDNVEPTVANGQWDGDVIEMEPIEKLSGAEILSLVKWAPEAANKPTGEIREDDVQPVITIPELSSVIKAQIPTKPNRFATASGHLPLLRLRLIDTISRVFGPAPVHIQLRRDIIMAAACRLRLVQLQAAVCPSITLPLSALKMINTFAAENKDKATNKIYENGIHMVITLSASSTPVIKARKPTEPYRSAKASGHSSLLWLRLMDTVSRVFGPTPVQIQLRLDIFMATASRLQLVQPTAIAPPIMPSIKPPSPSLETITAFDCLKLVWGSLSFEKKGFQANDQKLKIAPAPLFVKSKLTVLDNPKLSEPWLFKRMRYNNTAITPPVMSSIKSPSPSLETITAFGCLKLVWGSLSSEKKKNIKQTFKD